MLANGEVLPAVENFSDFIGQEQLKARLNLHLNAAVLRTEPMGHVLLAGPAGVGKSTLATLIAERLEENLTTLVMPLDRKALIRALQRFEGGVLFLDEIHAMSKSDQEILLPVLSESAVVDTRGRRYPIPWLTVVAATTERDKLIEPLVGRFPIKPPFGPYSDGELAQIVTGMAGRAGIALSQDMADVLGSASGGVPRNAEEFVLTYRDLMTTNPGHPVTAEMVLAMCDVDPDGLTDQHRQILNILSDQGGRAGQQTLELMLQVPGNALRALERLLVNKGLIEYLSSGRELTPRGVKRARGYEVQERPGR